MSTDCKGAGLEVWKYIVKVMLYHPTHICVSVVAESCFIPHEFSFSGPDSKLDLVVALLVTGLWPNVCWHREKRKVRFRVFLLICHFHSGIRCWPQKPRRPWSTRAVWTSQERRQPSRHLSLCSRRKCERGWCPARGQPWSPLCNSFSLGAAELSFCPMD